MRKTSKDYIFVSLQGILFIAFLGNIVFFNWSIPYWIQIASLFSAFIGMVIIIKAILQLNKNLSPFPSPIQNGQLIKDGLYQYVRHPIYSGILMTCFSLSIYLESFYKLIITILLYTLFYFKTQYEEKLLSQKYENYSSFKKTRGRFIPYLCKKSQL